MSLTRGEGSVAGAADPNKQVCPHFHGAVELIGRRWTGAILYSLADVGPMRFAELKECVPGMSDRLLSARLKELESAGLVRRDVSSTPRLRVSYELTRKGESLKPVIGAVQDWAQRWHPA